ncbi:MAG: FAD-binding protein, partial [Proteobacteria bacterium]|nr:FAD-binding protein [Pseudomonadota bacterium]
YTGAYFRMANEDEVAPDFFDHFAKHAGYHLDPALLAETARDYENWPAIIKTLSFTDPELISTFAEDAGPAVGWLKSHGVRFGSVSYYGLTARSSPRIAVEGGGLSLVETMAPAVEKAGATFFYETTARDLIQNDDGAVIGLKATGKRNQTITFHCGALILACGGFEGNPEMVARYLGPQGRYLRPVARGGYYNRGEGIRMALNIGASPAGDYSDYHAQPIDPRSSATEAIVMIFVHGIMVTEKGERFTDEAPGSIDYHYEFITRTIHEQPKGIAYAIMDAKLDEIENWRRTVRSDLPPIEAASLEELAAAIDIPAARLLETVETYNKACVEGDFDPYKLDGLSTNGLNPPKSHWARPIDTAPFKCYPIISSNTFTFGGLKVSPDAEVLNMSAEVIPGLYAAGETLGLYYGRYAGATSVLRGAVFGRRAGTHAAGLAKR